MKKLIFLPLSLLIIFTLIININICTAEENKNQNTQDKDNQQTEIQTNPDEMIGEIWSGSAYTSTFKAGACIAPDGKINGVLLVRLSNGQVDRYHFYGTKDKNGVIRTYHRSGYNFVGQFDSDTKISGKASLNSGFTFDLEGKRRQNVRLTKRCGPIEQ